MTTTSPVAAITELGDDRDAVAELRQAMSAAALAVGGANIVMQLANLGVGHGVATSPVDSGNLFLHPIKRARTTFGYVMITLVGTDAERQALGAAVTEVHRRVRSGSTGPVRFSAMDPKLQLWVAACIYRGLEDAHRLLHGDADPERLDFLYAHAARLGTTLQVPAEAWPTDRAAFDEYWEAAVAEIRMDDLTRAYLWDFTRLAFLPVPLPQLLGRLHQAITAGFLDEPFRRELGLPWGRAEQAVARSARRAIRLGNALTPPPLRQLPLDLYLWDMRRRLRNGRNIL